MTLFTQPRQGWFARSARKRGNDQETAAAAAYR